MSAKFSTTNVTSSFRILVRQSAEGGIMERRDEMARFYLNRARARQVA
jgi:hypothetical protein